MKRVSWKRAAKKKKFCAALMISLLLGGACFLRGEAAAAEPAGDGNPSGTEYPEENTGDAGLEAVEPKTSAAESLENEMPDTDISGADAADSEEPEDKDTKDPETGDADLDASGTEPLENDVPESDLSDKENSSPEDPGTEIQKSDGTESDDTEPKPPVLEPPKADAQNPETSGQKEPEVQQPAGTEPENTGSETPDTASPQAEPSAEQLPGLTCLQIPEKLEVVLDPWELDGETQIYSEPFTVKNTGDASGVLTLSFTCKVNKEGGVSICKTQEGLHDSQEKLLYMKAVFGDEEEVVFSEEGVQCQAVLSSGGEFTLRFEGEVNENVEEPWVNGDLEIKGTYSWEEGETMPEEDEENKSVIGEETDHEAVLPPVTEKGADHPNVETEKEIVGEADLNAETEQEFSEKAASTMETDKKSVEETDPSVMTQKESAGEVDSSVDTEQESAGKMNPSVETEKESAEEVVPSAETEKEPVEESVPASEASKEFPEENGLPESSS